MLSGEAQGARARVALGALLLSVVCPLAVADGFYAGPGAYFSSPDSGLHAKSDYGGQILAGYRLDDHWGAELLSNTSSYRLNDGTGKLSERGFDLQGMFRYPLSDERIAPFVTLGGGWMHTSYRNKNDDVPLARGGVGLNFDIPQTPLSVRADASLQHSFGNTAVPFYASQNMNERVYGVGLQYNFGTRDNGQAERRAESVPAAPPPPAASNTYPALSPAPAAASQAQATPAEPAAQTTAMVSSCLTGSGGNRCAVPGDQDGDGVPDSEDKCPDTPPNAVVDADGCLLYLRK